MGHCMFLRKGETHTAPVTGTPIGQLAVGSVIKLAENGVDAEYLIVHQGLPSSLYDESCDGTWLLRKNCYASRVWDLNDNDYENSDIHSFLNDTFLDLFDTKSKNAIKQVKIPYRKGTGSGGTTVSGSNGLSSRIFLLSGYEVGYTNSISNYLPIDGAKLDYFTDNSHRIANLNGTAVEWWLRSAQTNDITAVWTVGDSGGYSSQYYSRSYGIRPAFTLPAYIKIDSSGQVVV